MPKAKSNLDRILDIFQAADAKEARMLLDLAAREVREKEGNVSAPKRVRRPSAPKPEAATVRIGEAQ